MSNTNTTHSFTIKKWMTDSYESGKSTAALSYNDIIYGDLAPSWIFNDFDANELFEIGRQGHEFPEIASGWRYGNIPESGRSYNYREQVAERGVSMMQLDGKDKMKTLAEMRGSFDNRPKINVIGLLNPLEVGGDGEPLILCAHNSK